VGKSCDWEDFPGRERVMEDLNDNVHSPYMSERKRLKLHKVREDVQRSYSVIGPSMHTWNMLGDCRQNMVSSLPRGMPKVVDCRQTGV
jgi:hypothetical protein